MTTTVRRAVLAAAFLLIFWIFWSNTRVIVFMRGVDLLVFLVILGVLFLVIDHMLNRGQP